MLCICLCNLETKIYTNEEISSNKLLPKFCIPNITKIKANIFFRINGHCFFFLKKETFFFYLNSYHKSTDSHYDIFRYAPALVPLPSLQQQKYFNNSSYRITKNNTPFSYNLPLSSERIHNQLGILF